MTNETISAGTADAERSPPAWPRRRATVAALALVAVTLPYLALTFVYAGSARWDHALDQIINDPGKTLFHLLLLPAAVWLFVATFPKATIEAVRRNGRVRAFAWLVGAVSMIAVAWVTWDDADVRLKSGLMSSIELSHKYAAQLMDFETGLRDEMAQPSTGSPDSLQSRYLTEFGRLIGDPRDLTVLSSMNAVAYYGMVLSLIGASLAVFMLLAYLTAHFTRTMDMRTNESFLMVIGLLVPWLLLRAYSEWYALFGDVNLFLDYTPFVPALVLSVVGIFFCYLSRQRTRRPIVIAAGIMAAVPGILGIIGAISPDVASAAARIFYSTPLSTKFTVYAAIVVIVLGTGISLVPQRKGAARQQPG